MLDCLQLFFRSRDTLEGLLLKRLEADPSLASWIEAELALSPYAKKKKSGGRPAVDPELSANMRAFCSLAAAGGAAIAKSGGRPQTRGAVPGMSGDSPG